jgi:hypothetical protein
LGGAGVGLIQEDKRQKSQDKSLSQNKKKWKKRKMTFVKDFLSLR